MNFIWGLNCWSFTCYFLSSSSAAWPPPAWPWCLPCPWSDWGPGTWVWKHQTFPGFSLWTQNWPGETKFYLMMNNSKAIRHLVLVFSIALVNSVLTVLGSFANRYDDLFNRSGFFKASSIIAKEASSNISWKTKCGDCRFSLSGPVGECWCELQS